MIEIGKRKVLFEKFEVPKYHNEEKCAYCTFLGRYKFKSQGIGIQGEHGIQEGEIEIYDLYNCSNYSDYTGYNVWAKSSLVSLYFPNTSYTGNEEYEMRNSERNNKISSEALGRAIDYRFILGEARIRKICLKYV